MSTILGTGSPLTRRMTYPRLDTLLKIRCTGVPAGISSGETTEALITRRRGFLPKVTQELSRSRPKAASPSQGHARPGAPLFEVRGQVLHLVKGTLMPGARIIVRGCSTEALT